MADSRTPSPFPVIVVAQRAAARLRAGHVWVYRSDVEQMPEASPNSSEESGEDLVRIADPRGAPMGTALFSPHSQIVLRRIAETPLADRLEWLELLESRLRRSVELRRGFLDDETDACRLVSSEADRLPALVIDKYGDLMVLQILSKALDRDDVRGRIVSVLRESFDPAAVVERGDPRIRELERMPPPGSEPLYIKNSFAPETALSVVFHLNGLAFHYDAGAGQKTGAFLDQRSNYRAAATHARGEALDVCTYQGGFALHLARAGAKVTGVDISRAALEVAEENLAVNRSRIAGEVDWIEADAFDLLRDWSGSRREFDTIVLDPPAFAKSKRSVADALRGYRELNLRAFKMLRPGGTLVTCSCSHHVSAGDFQSIVAAAAGDAGRRAMLIERRGAAADHPVVLNIPETEYLKCLILRVD